MSPLLPARMPRLGRAGILLAVLTTIGHLATARGYGIFRDELYYLASTEHLDFGYVEHPPGVVLVAWVVRRTLGDSLHAIRVVPALCAGGVVVLAALLARRLGAGPAGQLLASSCAALAPVYLSLFSILSMNAADVLLWACALLAAARALQEDAPRDWIVVGLLVGIGLENKVSIGFLAAGLAAGVLLGGRAEILRRPWPWMAGAIATLLFLPHLLWQQANGWPLREFVRNATAEKNVAFAPGDFLSEHVMQMNPVTLPLLLAGLGTLLFAARLRPVRPLGIAYLTVVALMLTQNAKPYYLAPAGTLLFAAGAAALEHPLGDRRRLVHAATAVVFGTGLVAGPLAKPLLPVESYVRYAAALGFEPGTDERHELGRLPQFFADMHGWQQLAEVVARVYRALPEVDRERACVFGQNYGEAGAIDVLGRPLGLPPAISGHNSYALWGPRDCTGEVILVIGDDRETLETLFEEVTEAARFRCGDCMPYEDDQPIWVCRRPKVPIAELWPRIRRFI